MPEVSIGLYPDVGGSWFLQRMPGRVGLFLALTAAPMNAADAQFCGLADAHIEAGQREAVLQSLVDERWEEAPAANRARLGELLRAQAVPLQAPSRVREHFDLIQSVTQGDDLAAIAQRLRAVQSEDPWLQQAVATFAKGSPSSIALIFEIWRRARHLSLAQVFQLEFNASLGCCAHADFAEGIRALLVDKDRNPRWSPAALDAVTPARVQEHFEPRFEQPHPLANLA
jgi:enoyl-CoA hydratase/carnithine racemase